MTILDLQLVRIHRIYSRIGSSGLLVTLSVERKFIFSICHIVTIVPLSRVRTQM